MADRDDLRNLLERLFGGDLLSRQRMVYEGRNGRSIPIHEHLEQERLAPDGTEIADELVRKGFWDCGDPVIYHDGVVNIGGQCSVPGCGRIVCDQCFFRCGMGTVDGGCRRALCEQHVKITGRGEVFCEECYLLAENERLIQIFNPFRRKEE